MLRLSLLLLLAPLRVLTLPTPQSSSSTSAVQLIYEFSEQRLENIAARSNGHLALTVVNEPILYDFDPANPSPNLLHQFPGVTSLAGIAETSPDVFAVVAGNASTVTTLGILGTFSVWSVNLNTYKPTVRLITSIPGAEALNGMTALPGTPEIVLIADSSLGAVWRVNVITGDYSIAIENPLFANTTRSRGINGVHAVEGMLYFTNSAQGYGRIPISGDGSAAGAGEILQVTSTGSYDDFAVDWQGNTWIATHQDSLNRVTAGGEQSNTTSTNMQQPTSVKFGRGSAQEESTLYMVTYGNPAPGNGGGQILAIDTSLL